MSTPVRVLAFLLGLAAVFAAAVGVGTAVGPVGTGDTVDSGAAHEGMEPATEGGHDPGGAGHDTDDVGLPGGLAVSEHGYTLRLAGASAAPGPRVPISFTIEGPDGRPVTDFDVEHEKRLHLVAVRRDLTGFQHVHPTLAPDGTWSTELALRPGTWRVFADFNPTGGVGTTLGADLSVAGDFRPAADPPATTSATVDGYTVTLDGDLVAGQESAITLTVSRGGEPVTDLEPYLGAYGHLVALREGDLAYLHVHPDGAPGDGTTEPGPEVGFAVEVPSAGRYRLHLDFRHDGVVRTVELVVPATTNGQEENTDEH